MPIPEAQVLKQPDGTPARALFRHAVYNLKAVRAQERRSDLQGVNNIYVTGGYARGVGLHEECWIDGIELAAQMYEQLASSPAWQESAWDGRDTLRGFRRTEGNAW